MAAGNFGDCKPLRKGLFELRVDWAPGYRIYYTMIGKCVSCFYVAETKANNQPTSSGRWNI
jgi:putative addiction module killer protein